MNPLTTCLSCALPLLLLLDGAPTVAQVPRRAAPAPISAAPLPATALAVADTDTDQVFTLADLLTYVLLRHPMALQAGLLPARRPGSALRRGAVRPHRRQPVRWQNAGGTEYSHNCETQLRVPLWFGFDVKAGFERGTGAFVNPESYTAPAGLSYVGVSVPLAQGLLLDERRAPCARPRPCKV